MRIIFMGTPAFAAVTLDALCQAGHQVVLCVTQPDRPKGRKKKITPSPVKTAAAEKGIPVFQPEKMGDPAAVAELTAYEADIIVVVAFGQLLPKEMLDLVPYGCINVHASLLPRYRGAAPIQWAVLNGEKESGVTIMQMDEGLDTGDILRQQAVPLSENETYGSLSDKLAGVGADLCVRTLVDLEKGCVTPTPQGDSPTPYAARIQKSDGWIDWAEPAEKILRLIRGLDPWPSAYTRLEDQEMKIYDGAVAAGDSGQPAGTVTAVSQKDFVVQTGAGQLRILSLQMPGKKRMDTAAFLRGHVMEEGTRLR